jgi:serine/threonine protein kinase
MIKSGGYGKVYLAKHSVTGEEVAIKKINTFKLSKL